MAENNLQSPPAVVTAQITVTRAGTGKVEHYTLVGTPVAEPPQSTEQPPKEH